MSPRSSTRPSTASEKKITRGYKAKLTKAERKAFRSRMWEFRRDPTELTDQQRQQLEALFNELPQLRKLYQIRVRFKEIFDAPWGWRQAHRALLELFGDMVEEFPELEAFVRTFEAWDVQILNYFAARQTSAAVEGLNNKARVILKRAYGLKAVESLWTRLILDVNRATDVVLYTIREIRELVAGFRAEFACT